MKYQIRKWLTLRSLVHSDDAAFLALRLITGVFLGYGVWDNVTNANQMTEFIRFLSANGFVTPNFWAPFSVYTQLLAAILIILGLATRWAGIIIVGTFTVALWMVHFEQTLREQWPALALVAIGLALITHGAGRFSLDTWLEKQGEEQA